MSLDRVSLDGAILRGHNPGAATPRLTISFEIMGLDHPSDAA